MQLSPFMAMLSAGSRDVSLYGRAQKGKLLVENNRSTMSAARSFKLFVGNLPWTVGRRELSEYFSKFGPLKSATVVFSNETGLSKGFGFVDFVNKEGYDSAVSQDHHALEGSKLTLGAFYSGRQRPSTAGTSKS